MNLMLLLSLGVLVASGCNAPTRSSRTAPQQRTAPAASGGNHVNMPPRDLAIEMQKHCQAAQRSLDQAIRDLQSGKGRDTVGDLLVRVQQDMRSCNQMAHGVYERYVGEPSLAR